MVQTLYKPISHNHNLEFIKPTKIHKAITINIDFQVSTFYYRPSGSLETHINNLSTIAKKVN